MRIAINGLQRILLHKLLMMEVHVFPYWMKERQVWQNCRGDDSAIVLLNRLEVEDVMSSLEVEGCERELLLYLLALKLVPQHRLVPVGRDVQPLTVPLAECAKQLFDSLQPQGVPIGADVGDIVLLKDGGFEYEIVHFSGSHPDCLVDEETTEIMVCRPDRDNMDEDREFPSFPKEELMWPVKKYPAEILWG